MSIWGSLQGCISFNAAGPRPSLKTIAGTLQDEFGCEMLLRVFSNDTENSITVVKFRLAFDEEGRRANKIVDTFLDQLDKWKGVEYDITSETRHSK